MFEKNKDLPWQVYIIMGEKWELHSSYVQRSLAEACLRTVKQYQPNIQMEIVQKTV